MIHFIFLSWQLVVIVDPHIKVDPTYTLYSQAKDKGYFVKDRNGQDFEGICWPGKKTTLSLNFKLFIIKNLQNSLIGTHESGIKFLDSMHFL